jgi:hypothetical protein
MSEEVAVIIPVPLETAQAFQKIFPSAQIRRIKRREEPQEPVKKNTPEDREKLLREIVSYCQGRSSHIDGVRFFNYYESRGWVDASGKEVTDWKAKIEEWEHNGLNVKQKPSNITGSKVVEFPKEQLEKMVEDLDKI